MLFFFVSFDLGSLHRTRTAFRMGNRRSDQPGLPQECYAHDAVGGLIMETVGLAVMDGRHTHPLISTEKDRPLMGCDRMITRGKKGGYLRQIGGEQINTVGSRGGGG